MKKWTPGIVRPVETELTGRITFILQNPQHRQESRLVRSLPGAPFSGDNCAIEPPSNPTIPAIYIIDDAAADSGNNDSGKISI